MNEPITLREACSQPDLSRFWQQLHAYHRRDLFPEPDSEDLAYFLSEEYHADIEQLRTRETDRCRLLHISCRGVEIGLAMAVLYASEDNKCFLMEFCVYPEFRGSGVGTRCAEAFLDWARREGAAYFELNCNTAQRQQFWSRLGFRPNGADEWGVPLMLLPPEDPAPITVEMVTEPDWQLWKLENGFLAEIGEDTLTEERQERLRQAILCGKITFFLARRGHRAVGMCSVSPCFSTFACADCGVFEDFFIEPVFRGHGIARKLVQAARQWSLDHGLSGLTVCCAPCDREMYQALGFAIALGQSFSMNF